MSNPEAAAARESARTRIAQLEAQAETLRAQLATALPAGEDLAPVLLSRAAGIDPDAMQLRKEVCLQIQVLGPCHNKEASPPVPKLLFGEIWAQI